MLRVFSEKLFSMAVAMLIAASATPAVGQMLNEGCEPYRTRLIPYPSAIAASQRELSRQRYMQPITEWDSVEGDRFIGEFTFPFSWLERQVFMRVEGVGAPYEVWVNGRCAGVSANGYAPVEFNVTKLSREDKNSVELRLIDNSPILSIESFEVSRNSSPVAYIISQPRVRVRDVMVDVEIGYGGVANALFSVVMQNLTLGAKSSRLYYELYYNDTVRLGAGHRDVRLGMHGVDTLRFGLPTTDTMLWSRERPQRLSLRMHNRIEGRDVEFYDIPVALRELDYDGTNIYINREPWGCTWRDISPDATIEDVATAAADGVALRFTAGGVSEEVLDYCDSAGIYVALTAPINSSKSGPSRRKGGNPSNDPSWRECYIERIVQMILSTKRHSSVVAYYLADDSANGISLYEGYLAAKRVAGDRAVFYLDGGGEWNSDFR